MRFDDKSFAETLLPYMDVILFDPRGCGRSKESLVEYCSLEHYIDDVEAVRHTHNTVAICKVCVVALAKYPSLQGVCADAGYRKTLEEKSRID